MIFQLAVAFTILAFTTAESALYSSNLNKQLSLFDEFKRAHGKSYASEEEEGGKFQVFVANLQLADSRNEAERLNGGTAVHGVTKFFDITPEEFTASYLRTTHPDSSAEKKAAKTIHQQAVTPQANTVVDWTGTYTTAVKNQCRCGCGWAFAAVEQIESDAIRTKNWSVNSPLSTAQACECTYSAYNLNGGCPDDAYNYVKSVGGIQPDVIHPFNSTYYCGTSSSCSATSCPTIACTAATSSSYAVKVIDYYYTPIDEPSIASFVQTTGPVQVFVSASAWHTYISGTMTVCPSSGIDHTVQAVGVDTVAGYWKLRNSWGSNWGEAGYIYLAYNQNMCNIGLTGATYTAVELSKNPTAGPTAMPFTPETTFCPSFSITDTNTDTINYDTCSFSACPGDTVVMSTFSPGSCTGDTYLRLFDPSTGNQLAENDDYDDSLCSEITYTFTESCRVYTLREECYPSTTCGGQVMYSGNTISVQSPSLLTTQATSTKPTTNPTQSPSRLRSRAPSTKPTTTRTHSPSRRPSRAPSTKPTTSPTQSPST